MKLYKKLATELDSFVRVKGFVVFHISIVAMCILGAYHTDYNLPLWVLTPLGIVSLLFIDFSVMNDLFGRYIFNDRHIWPIRFAFWEVVDVKNNSESEMMDMVFWCRANCEEGLWRQCNCNWFLFKNKDDAFMFRLVW